MKFKFTNGFFFKKGKLPEIIMRVFIFLCFTTTFSFTPSGAFSQNAKIKIDSDMTISVAQIFELIQQQAGYKFIYSDDLITNAPEVELKRGIIRANELLKKGLSPIGCTFEFTENETVIVKRNRKDSIDNFLKKDSNDNVQPQINGTVTDENGQPLPGASIVVKGTNTGTTTDFDGKFAISLKDPDAILVVSYIGYLTKEIALNGQTTFTISLSPSTANLDEVVLVGYTEKKIKDLTGSVGIVKLKDIKSQPIVNVEEALQGRVAGAQVTGDGSPGGAISVRIRGYGTIGNNDPLYVIDGVPTKTGLNQFNVNDIASIQILKDAAASAIYGARAANGVVIITTKKGSYSGSRSITFDTYTGLQEATNLPKMLNTSQYANLLWDAQRNAGLIPSNEVFGNNPDSPTIPDFLDSDQLIPSSLPGTDWFDELFNMALTSSYNLGYQSGNEFSRMAFSGSYLNQKGVMDYSGFERYTARINTEFKTSDEIFTIGQNLTYSFSNRTSFSTNAALGSRIIHAYRMNPIVPLKDVNGDWASSVVGVQGAENPVALNYFDRNDLNQSSRIFGNVYGMVNPLKGLVFKTDFGLDYQQLNSKNYNPRFSMGDAERAVNFFSKSNTVISNWVWNNTLNYKKEIGDHSLSALVGAEAIHFSLDQFGASRENFFTDDLDFVFLDTGEGNQTNFGRGTEWSLFSLFGRIDYSYDGKYLFGASLRRDGSSRFNSNNRYSIFPAFSLGWRISSESFFEKISFVNDLKFRFSWGESGNQEIGDFASFSNFATNSNDSNFDINGTNTSVVTGFSASRIGNPNIVWETTTQTNIGIDAQLFDNRLNFVADYFIKDTDDILLQRPTLAVEGQAEAPFVNAGKMRNKGLELQLSFNHNFSDDFSFNIGINGSFIENEVLRLADDVEFIPGFVSNSSTRNLTISRTQVGSPIAQFYGHIADGIFNNQSEVDSHAQQTGKAIGRVRYKDLNSDGQIDDNDRKIIGNPHPDIIYGFNLGAKFKQLDMSMFFQGIQGVDLYNFTRYYTDFFFDSGNKHSRILEAWTPSNPNTTIPRISSIDTNNELRPSTYFVEDGSYLRLKNLQIGYTYLFGKEKDKNIRFYIQGTNLFTITNYQGIDPEVSLVSSSSRNRNLDIGVDRGIYPNNKTISLGLNVKF